MAASASIYVPSRREMPDRLPPLEYPGRFEVRYVSYNGGIRRNKGRGNVTITCAGDYVGLEEIGDGLRNALVHSSWATCLKGTCGSRTNMAVSNEWADAMPADDAMTTIPCSDRGMQV